MIKVTGIEEIDKVLKGLPLQVTDRVLQQAGRAAAKPLINYAQAYAAKKSGNLSKSIGFQTGSFNQVKSMQRVVGQVVAGPRRGRYKGYHAHLIEYGTKKRVTKGKGKNTPYKKANRGAVTARPFMRPAFDATHPMIVQNYNMQVGRKLYNFMKKTIRNSA